MIEYTLQDVLNLCGIEYPAGNVVRIRCPFCQGSKINKDFSINFTDQSFGCFRCGITSRYGTMFYAILHNITSKEAHKEIVQQLGISESSKKMQYKPRENPQPQISEDAEMAPIEVLDNTYKNLLKCLSLSQKNREDLLSRGFYEEELLNLEYVTYPKKNPDSITQEYFSIPRKLQDASCTLRGVPGFFRTKNKGVWSLCARKGGILIPYRDFNNRIQCFQLRKNNEELEIDDETGEKEYKYSWIASGGLRDGSKASTKIHYAVDFKWDPDKSCFIPDIKGNKVLLTEGAMKGDLTHAISGIPVICVPGVNSAVESLQENIPLLKSIGVDTIIIAYDMDRVMNIHVIKALRAMKDVIEKNGMNCQQTSWSNEIVKMDGTHEIMDVANTFVFTSDMMKIWDMKKVNKVLDDVQALNLNVLFALSNKADASKENYDHFMLLKKECENRNLSVNCVFWSLHLKGIDDYYAHKKRDIQYETHQIHH